jgi:hypothetical protein
MALPRRLARLLFALLLAGALMALGACSDEGDGESAATTTTANPNGLDSDDEDGETSIPVLPEEERDFGIAADPRADEISAPAQEHFADRWAGTSFDIPEDEPPTMRLHVVAPTDDDRSWVRELVESVEPGWVALVRIVEAERSLGELRDLLTTIIERAADLGVSAPVQLDTAGNRILIADDSIAPDVRAQLREGLPEGSVVFPDEILDEDDDEAEDDAEG